MEPPATHTVEAQHIRDGVVLLRGVVRSDQQEEAAHKTNLEFLPFAHLFTLRLPRKSHQAETTGSTATSSEDAAAGAELSDLLAHFSSILHESLYGVGGLWANLPENGCSEDHEGRSCGCPDRTPLLPRSTQLNCVEGLIYKAGTQRAYHRDAHWLLALSFGCPVRMGFHRHDDQDPVELTVPSGDAVLFNGALHSHAVLGIGAASDAPTWWSYPFARAVFLMRDARQTVKARRRQEARRAAAGQGAKEAAEVAAARGNADAAMCGGI